MLVGPGSVLSRSIRLFTSHPQSAYGGSTLRGRAESIAIQGSGDARRIADKLEADESLTFSAGDETEHSVGVELEWKEGDDADGELEVF